MAFGLSISFRERRVIPRDQCFTEPNVLQPIPEAEMVIEYIMAAAWTLCFGGISKPVVARPYALRRLHIGLPDAWNKI